MTHVVHQNRSSKQNSVRFLLTNYIRMAISCGRTATPTRSWVAWASRCLVENLGRTNRSNGGNTSWQPRRKPPRKRNTKRADARFSEIPKASQEKHLLRGFSVLLIQKNLGEAEFLGPTNYRSLISNRADSQSPHCSRRLIRFDKRAHFQHPGETCSALIAARCLVAFRGISIFLPDYFHRASPHAG